MSTVGYVLATLATVWAAFGAAATYEPRAEFGLPGGLIPECPGVMKNVTISFKLLPKFRILHHSFDWNGQITMKSMPIMQAAKLISRDKSFDLKRRKTVIYACGFLDSSAYPTTQAIAASYVRKGYNVLVSETFNLLNRIYPLSARIAREIGKKIGDLLIKLSNQGLQPENIELVGISLGAHIVAFAAKHYYRTTGKKPSRITGLDPAGPCFRGLTKEHRLDPSDADRVDVLHTNIDGFGIADRLGHVDFYANGGEFQPGDVTYVPCLVVCSHIRALIYFWQALEHPKKFIGMKCDSVQDARLAKCYNSTVTNYLGLETKFNKPGVYYLPTFNEFPYYRGKDGLKAENEIYTSIARQINDKDNLVIN